MVQKHARQLLHGMSDPPGPACSTKALAVVYGEGREAAVRSLASIAAGCCVKHLQVPRGSADGTTDLWPHADREKFTVTNVQETEVQGWWPDSRAY